MKDVISPALDSIAFYPENQIRIKLPLIFFMIIYFILPVTGVIQKVATQPMISSDPMPASFDVEALVRNGNTAFEGALFTPGTPGPGEPGGEPWQMDPPGNPIWSTNGNFYGDQHSFLFNYSSATGTTVWKIDFNRDGDYNDPQEMVTSASFTLMGLGFKYVNITGQGASGIQVALTDFVLNGINFGSFTSSGTAFSSLFEETSGLFTDITASGNFSFAGNGGLEFPNIMVRLGSTNEPPVCDVTNPLEGAYFDINDTIVISSVASDNDGSIAVVEFYYGVTKIGEDSFPPYSLDWIASVPGMLSINVHAIDNFGATTVSPFQTIISNAPPVCAITNHFNGELLYDPPLITVNVMATDINDNVNAVEFFLNGISIGQDFTPPYQNSTLVNLPMGMYTLTAKATDTYGVITTSAPVQITVRCIREDMDNNGIVNTFDFLQFLSAFGDPCTDCDADFNVDGFVNTTDFLHLLTKIGYTCN